MSILPASTACFKLSYRSYDRSIFTITIVAQLMAVPRMYAAGVSGFILMISLLALVASLLAPWPLESSSQPWSIDLR